jgi:bifunctional UDP-N-acetylglucosamine pyrophosphorylase/glucosamine-1-phosphate N-acetyltransferase
MSDPVPTPTRPTRTCLAVVLAAGEGTRMRSGRPKVLHELAGRSMLAHVLAAVREAGATRVAVVIGPDRADVGREAERALPGVEIVVQRDRLGTAHAVLAARAALERGADDVIVAFGDTPLIKPSTFTTLRKPLGDGALVSVLGFEARDPSGYGRLVREGDRLLAIREHRDASEAERAITLCNAGLMGLSGAHALRILDGIGNANAKGEYYLTDAVEVVAAMGAEVVAVVADEDDVLGINDRVQLAGAEAILQGRLRRQAMENGATLVGPETVFLCADSRIGKDVLIEPHVVFGPGVVIEDGVTIHAFSHLEGARVASGASVGPFARLRPGAYLQNGAKVGNFVEIKNAAVGEGAKVSHLTYLGDAEVGPHANIGAGTITCNYDGFFKHRTTIGEGAFVGSNSALVAPVTIGAGAYVGSGSVVTEDVPIDALAVARGRQATKAGWAAEFRAASAARKAAAKSEKGA